MEDNQHKLDLMLTCYLGKWHPLYGDSVQFREFGFGNLSAISGYAMNYRDGINKDGAGRFIRETYDMIFRLYESLPFGELDKSDPDFELIFAVRPLIQELGKTIDDFFRGQVLKGDEIVALVSDIIHKGQNPDYADRIKALCTRMQSPAKTLNNS